MRVWAWPSHVAAQLRPHPSWLALAGTSIWAPRRKWCDGRDFYDHDNIMFERFSHDWKVALRLGIVKLIMMHDDDGLEDADGDGIPDEVVEVGAVLFTYCQVLECTIAPCGTCGLPPLTTSRHRRI